MNLELATAISDVSLCLDTSLEEVLPQWLKNTKEAQEYWKTVRPDLVDLQTYRCGTVACFAGWLPFSPYFKSIGMTAAPSGEPRLGEDGARPFKLFGGHSLYYSRYESAHEGTDYEAVVKRLDDHLKYLERLEAALAEQTKGV